MGRVAAKYIGGEYVRKHKPDYVLVAIMVLLLLIGLIVVYTTSPGLEVKAVVSRQLAHIGLGLVAFGLTATLPINAWRKLQLPLILLALAASFALLVPGLALELNGATRWIDLGFVSFQPAEIIKFAAVVYLAVFLSERIRLGKLNDSRQTLVPVLIVTAIIGLLVAILQRDLGTMAAIVGIILVMLYVSGIKFRHLGVYLGSILGVGAIATVLFPHRLSRLLTFFDPSRDIEGAAYHINQALIAVGSGGWFGKGLGKSVQAFGYLPEAINDSIFAVVAEEFGFIGSLLVLFLYVALFVRMVRIIQRSPNDYMRLLATGVFSWLFAHTVINIGAMVGLMPLTGITLPFLSFGGTSLLFIMAGVGLVFNISRYTSLAYIKGDNKSNGLSKAHRTRRRRNSRPRYAAQSYRLRA